MLSSAASSGQIWIGEICVVWNTFFILDIKLSTHEAFQGDFQTENWMQNHCFVCVSTSSAFTGLMLGIFCTGIAWPPLGNVAWITTDDTVGM